ncbi:MAG: hypothetical protein IKF49_01435 [Clostridia bacterium]|nr:hypothetical protein [Clostridia bacterium]
MKSRVLSIISMMLCLLFILTGCGSSAGTEAKTEAVAEPAAIDWAHYKEWTATDWNKAIAYQFTGHWDMGDPQYNIVYDFLINLYEDGSVCGKQAGYGGRAFTFYGFWTAEDTEDGKEITLTMRKETPLEGASTYDDLLDHKYTYTLYEESDGGFSFAFDFGIIPGEYMRTVDMAGSASVQFDTLDAFIASLPKE